MSELFWSQLTRRVENAVDAYPGVVGIFLRDLGSDASCAVHADVIFPAASTIKIAVAAAMLEQAAHGAVDLTATVRVAPDDGAAESGILHFLRDPVELTWHNVLTLMIVLSDNTATNLCIDCCGMETVNGLIDRAGLTQTRLRRSMADWAAAVDNDNVTSPADLAALVTKLVAGWPSASVAEGTLALMAIEKNDLLQRAIGARVPVLSKPGRLPGSWSDVGMVKLPHRPYVIALMTKYDPSPDECRAVALLRMIHEQMSIWDASNPLGHAVYPLQR